MIIKVLIPPWDTSFSRNTTGNDSGGFEALQANQIGVKSGKFEALHDNLESSNTAVGYTALQSNTDGIDNVAGAEALQANLVVVKISGAYALTAKTDGTGNVVQV